MKRAWSCDDYILCGVAAPPTDSGLTDLSRMHIPVIDAPRKVKRNELVEVKLRVGKGLDHPNEADHFIEWIELYCGDTFLARVYFKGGRVIRRW